jgi:hypothetical protein
MIQANLPAFGWRAFTHGLTPVVLSATSDSAATTAIRAILPTIFLFIFCLLIVCAAVTQIATTVHVKIFVDPQTVCFGAAAIINLAII